MKDRLGIGIGAAIILFLLWAVPASAGYVTIVNKSQERSCSLNFYGYLLNYPTVMDTPCAKPGGKEWTHTSLSVGQIYVFCGSKDSCSRSKYIIHKIDGTWLPHRNFKITVEDIPGWRETDIKTTLTEEGP